MTEVNPTSQTSEANEAPKPTINVPALQTFNPQTPAEYGNHVLRFIIDLGGAEAQLTEAQSNIENARQNLGLQMTQALLKIAEEDKDINLRAIFEGGKAVERLNTRILVALGVIVRKPDPDGEGVITSWTDEKVRDMYAYAQVDKEKNKAEYERRFNNRKRLNLRLSDACKAAIALMDAGATADSIKFVEENGMVKPQLTKAPKEIAGENPDATVNFGERKLATGATLNPTLTSLVKIATDKHKRSQEESTERSDKGNDRSGEAKLAMTDEAFGGMVNNLKRAIAAQEGRFTEDMIRQLQSLVPVVTAAVEQGVFKPEPLPEGEDEGTGEGEGGEDQQPEQTEQPTPEPNKVSNPARAKRAK